jgi:hypothetical protein
VSDPTLARLLTSTGRVGHLTRFGVDGFVGDNPGFAVEVKARKKMLTKPAIDALLQTIDRAARFERIPLFAIVFGDDVPARTEKFQCSSASRKFLNPDPRTCVHPYSRLRRSRFVVPEPSWCVAMTPVY